MSVIAEVQELSRSYARKRASWHLPLSPPWNLASHPAAAPFVALAGMAAASLIPAHGRTQRPLPIGPHAATAYDAGPDSAKQSPAVYDPRMPRRAPGRLKHVCLEISHQKILIASGVEYDAWTLGGTVPGPVMRVTQGDTVDVTIVNNANVPHSVDFHSAQIAPNRAYRNLLPQESMHYRSFANVVGAFMYHCGTAPAAQMIANGMYGAFIVDPVQALPRAQEFVLVQSEFYTTPEHGKAQRRAPRVPGLRGL